MLDVLIIEGVDISHLRLVDLVNLADQIKPFYLWIEKIFQETLQTENRLEEIILSSSAEQLSLCISASYFPVQTNNIPVLFNGVGKTYPHHVACFYFFAWIIRDASKQRLAPLIQKIVKGTGKTRIQIEIEVITLLIIEYRSLLKTFSWEVIREIVIDRLEGSRRSIRGHEKEQIIRKALVMAIQTYFSQFSTYGIFSRVEILVSQVMINNESYDVGINMFDSDGDITKRLFVAIKTRETEGGGHSHLFSRDISSAIDAIKLANKNDYLMVVIIAKNWSQREVDNLVQKVDNLIIVNQSPSDFIGFNSNTQKKLERIH
jgi:hypothetical protein